LQQAFKRHAHQRLSQIQRATHAVAHHNKAASHRNQRQARIRLPRETQRGGHFGIRAGSQLFGDAALRSHQFG